ncbi:zinc ribbon domain-containing protein [Paenibacillus sp. MZ04-78.2]|uniref:zinc ribbon domain-containing protein n=1 Tax=Paenibacillus sp. MZ04-78.2 TaxID=2962034 RepID=UPI0035CA671A
MRYRFLALSSGEFYKARTLAVKAMDRTYQCSCGYRTHRDRVGAINIMRQPVIDGSSLHKTEMACVR